MTDSTFLVALPDDRQSQTVNALKRRNIDTVQVNDAHDAVRAVNQLDKAFDAAVLDGDDPSYKQGAAVLPDQYDIPHVALAEAVDVVDRVQRHGARFAVPDFTPRAMAEACEMLAKTSSPLRATFLHPDDDDLYRTEYGSVTRSTGVAGVLADRDDIPDWLTGGTECVVADSDGKTYFSGVLTTTFGYNETEFCSGNTN